MGASIREPADTLYTEIEPVEVTLSKISFVFVLSTLVSVVGELEAKLGIEEVSRTV